MALFKPDIAKCNFLKNGVLSLIRFSRGVAEKSVSESEKLASTSAHDLLRKTVKPSKYHKMLLVWTGRFKNVAEVPETISFETMQKARNKVRIKMSNYMMAATILACIVMVYSGKKAAGAGESVSKMNLDWHKEYNEQAKAEAEAKKNKT